MISNRTVSTEHGTAGQMTVITGDPLRDLSPDDVKAAAKAQAASATLGSVIQWDPPEVKRAVWNEVNRRAQVFDNIARLRAEFSPNETFEPPARVDIVDSVIRDAAHGLL